MFEYNKTVVVGNIKSSYIVYTSDRTWNKNIQIQFRLSNGVLEFRSSLPRYVASGSIDFTTGDPVTKYNGTRFNVGGYRLDLVTIQQQNSFEENSGANQVIYTATAVDARKIEFTLKDSNNTFVVILPDNFENGATFWATKILGSNTVGMKIKINIIGSDVTVTYLQGKYVENVQDLNFDFDTGGVDNSTSYYIGSVTVISTTDTTDLRQNDSVTMAVDIANSFEIGGVDAHLFTIDETSGVVRLTANPDFEKKI